MVNEVDLDREMDEQRRRDNGELVSDEESSDEGSDEDDWEKPSAYSLLMGSLKKTSKNQDFYNKIQREQEGLEEIADDDSDVEEEDFSEDALVSGEEGEESLSGEEGKSDSKERRARRGTGGQLTNQLTNP